MIDIKNKEDVSIRSEYTNEVNMKTEAWLTINNRGSLKITKGKPSLNWNEVSLKLCLELPDSVFKQRERKRTLERTLAF